MPNVNWTWLLVGLLLGWLAIPSFQAAVVRRKSAA